MPRVTLSRESTAHVEGSLANGSPDAVLDRDSTGRVRARLTIGEPGD